MSSLDKLGEDTPLLECVLCVRNEDWKLIDRALRVEISIGIRGIRYDYAVASTSRPAH